MTTMKALNHYLPRDIAVKAAYRSDDDFNIRGDALSREYCYHILNSDTRSPLWERFALHISAPLEVKLMNQACQLILGEHDFTSFTTFLGDSKSAVRNVCEAEVDKKEAVVTFRMTAASFLPHQVRNTVGLLIKLGLNKVGIEHFQDVMDAKVLGLAGPRAPACGLCLNKVNYAGPLGVQQ
jgi:tRNA pseudouridine38-40 synthase